MNRISPVVRRVGDVLGRETVRPLNIALVRGPLVFSSRSINNEATPSVAFAYLSASLMQAGHSVTWVDAIAEGLNRVWELEDYPGYSAQGLTFDEVIERIPKDADVIGFSGMFSGEWPILRDLIIRIRANHPEALFVAGGEHITALTELSLRQCPALDVCVRGEGEQTFLLVCETYAENREFVDIAGTAFLDKDGQYREGAGIPRIRDIDNLPWPHWPEGYLEDFWAAGKSYGVASERDMPMMVSRGCPFRCTFCSNEMMWTTRYVLREVDDIIAEIKHYIERYNITAIQLYDLTAITKRKWAIELCQRLLSEKIQLKWSLPSGTRSEALDEETLTLLRDTGCNYLVYAPESGSPKTLERIQKQISLEKLTESALTAKRLGLTLRTNLIIGFPGETRRDVVKTILYGLKLAVKGVDEVSINIFSPYPGTRLFEMLRDKNVITTDDAYFLKLTSLNSDYTAVNPLTVNETMGPRELAIYRLFFMLSNYALGYLVYPHRILRTLRNLRTGHGSATVLEHRLSDMLRRRASKRSQKKGEVAE